MKYGVNLLLQIIPSLLRQDKQGRAVKQVEEHMTEFVTYPKIFQMNWKVIHKPELKAQ